MPSRRDYAGLYALLAILTALTAALGATYGYNTAYRVGTPTALGDVHAWGLGMLTAAGIEAAAWILAHRLAVLAWTYGIASLGWVWAATLFATHLRHNHGLGEAGVALFTAIALIHLSATLTANGYDRNPRPRR